MPVLCVLGFLQKKIILKSAYDMTMQIGITIQYNIKQIIQQC